VHAQSLNLVNASNITTYAVPYNSTTAGSDVYRSISGDYYYVAFSSAQPDARIVATPQGSRVLAYGALALLGIICVIAGIVVAAVGAVRKDRSQIPTMT